MLVKKTVDTYRAERGDYTVELEKGASLYVYGDRNIVLQPCGGANVIRIEETSAIPFDVDPTLDTRILEVEAQEVGVGFTVQQKVDTSSLIINLVAIREEKFTEPEEYITAAVQVRKLAKRLGILDNPALAGILPTG